MNKKKLNKKTLWNCFVMGYIINLYFSMDNCNTTQTLPMTNPKITSIEDISKESFSLPLKELYKDYEKSTIEFRRKFIRLNWRFFVIIDDYKNILFKLLKENKRDLKDEDFEIICKNIDRYINHTVNLKIKDIKGKLINDEYKKTSDFYNLIIKSYKLYIFHGFYMCIIVKNAEKAIDLQDLQILNDKNLQSLNIEDFCEILFLGC